MVNIKSERPKLALVWVIAQLDTKGRGERQIYEPQS